MSLFTETTTSELQDSLQGLQARKELFESRVKEYSKALAPEFQIEGYKKSITDLSVAIHSIKVLLLINSVIDS